MHWTSQFSYVRAFFAANQFIADLNKVHNSCTKMQILRRWEFLRFHKWQNPQRALTQQTARCGPGLFIMCRSGRWRAQQRGSQRGVRTHSRPQTARERYWYCVELSALHHNAHRGRGIKIRAHMIQAASAAPAAIATRNYLECVQSAERASQLSVDFSRAPVWVWDFLSAAHSREIRDLNSKYSR